MKISSLGLVLFFAGVAWAAEPLKLPMDVGTLKTRDGKVLEGAKIVGHDAVGVRVIHSSGTARLTYDRLPRELAARFPRDPDAAKRQLEEEARQDAEHEAAVNDALKPRTEPADEVETETETEADAVPPAEEEIAPLEQEVKLEGSAQAKISALEAYIARLEKGIAEEAAAADELQQKANKHREAGKITVTEVGPNGKIYDREDVNSSRDSRARFYEKRKEKHTKKIDEAKKLIQSARAKIFSLQRSAVTKP